MGPLHIAGRTSRAVHGAGGVTITVRATHMLRRLLAPETACEVDIASTTPPQVKAFRVPCRAESTRLLPRPYEEDLLLVTEGPPVLQSRRLLVLSLAGVLAIRVGTDWTHRSCNRTHSGRHIVACSDAATKRKTSSALVSTFTTTGSDAPSNSGGSGRGARGQQAMTR